MSEERSHERQSRWPRGDASSPEPARGGGWRDATHRRRIAAHAAHPARHLRRHGARGGCPGRRAPPARPPGHPLRPGRFGDAGRAGADRRAEPLVASVPRRSRLVHEPDPGQGLGAARPLRYHPQPRGDAGLPVRSALPDTRGHHAARSAGPLRHARAPRGVPRHPARGHQREPATLVTAGQLGRHDPPRIAARPAAVPRSVRAHTSPSWDG